MSYLKIAEDRHRHLEARELFPGHRAEPTKAGLSLDDVGGDSPGVLHGRGDGVLPQTMVQLHVVESPNAA